MRAHLLDPIDMCVDLYARVKSRCRDSEPNKVMHVMHQLPRCFVIALCGDKSKAERKPGYKCPPTMRFIHSQASRRKTRQFIDSCYNVYDRIINKLRVYYGSVIWGYRLNFVSRRIVVDFYFFFLILKWHRPEKQIDSAMLHTLLPQRFNS